MNRVNPKKLLQSKWTKVNVVNKEKHFMITEVSYDEFQKVVACTIEAIKTHENYDIDWQELKDSRYWHIGWQ